jgi:hypothetical protein
MMAPPKIGPRGITIEDVQNVANNGISQKDGTSYKSISKPTATSPVDYAALLAGGPASTYGEKYAGQPSGEYAKQMILGAAMQAKSIGDLAALQAATNQQNLTSKFASDLLAGTNKLSPIFREKFNQPMLDSNNRNVQIQNLTPAISDLEARLAERKRYARRIGAYEQQRQGTGREIDILQEDLRDTRRALGQVNPTGKTPEQLAAENKANAYGAYMTRMNMLDPSTGGTIPEMLRAGAQRQTATNLTPALEAALAEQVTPYETVAQGFANTPLSQFAQQIAVNRYGYDPALAAGLFDTSVDIQSLKDEADLFAAQNPQLSMSPAEIVYNQLGEEGLNQYLQQQAEQALIGSPSQQRTEAELAQDAANAPIDAELYSAYATAPGDLSSALNADVARQYMSDPNFLAQFQAGTTQIYDEMGKGVSGADAVNAYIRNYLNETADPVSARILEELLSNIAFG